MSILHLVRRSAFDTHDFEQCIQTLSSNHTLVLIDDGCYNIHHPLIKQVAVPIKVMEVHALARGLNLDDITNLIDMTELVNLTFTHNSVMTWQ